MTAEPDQPPTGTITTGKITADSRGRGSPRPALEAFPPPRRSDPGFIFIGMLALGCTTAALALFFGAF